MGKKKKNEQGLHKEETEKANKHMKRLSTLDIREMKNKTGRRYCPQEWMKLKD